MNRAFGFAMVLFLSLVSFASCGSSSPDDGGGLDAGELSLPSSCELVTSGHGPTGTSALRVEKLVTGLEVPWSIAFVNATDFLVTEREGRVRLVRGGTLESAPVFELENASSRSEGGLLGLALHPNFAANRFAYVYYTARTPAGGEENRVERYRIANDFRSATLDRVILAGIPAGTFHDGGRLKFGPDGMLYVGTGDARDPRLSQDLSSPAGKILRLTPEGGIPGDNPFAGNAAFILGIRNMQAFDWIDRSTLVVADHGPSGELGRSGHDEVSFARAGDNLGWPDQWRCEEATGRVRPFLVWRTAAPPGGLVRFTGDLIPEWRGSILIATLKSAHLHRISFQRNGDTIETIRHEVYFKNRYGRLREVVQAPDGSLLITTSNCDGRGTCGTEKDSILRVTKD